MKRAIKKIKPLGKFGALLIGGIMITSCLNNDDSDVIPQEDSGYVLFTNISPGSSNLKLFVNDEPFNNSDLNYNEYFGGLMPIGTNELTLKGNSASGVLDTISLSVELNKIYSVFAVNSSENIELLAYADNPSAPTNPNKTVVRFIQLSHNCPAVRVAIEGLEGDLGTFNFRNASSYMEIDRVLNKNLYLINAESNDTIFTKSVTFNGNQAYSIFSEGDINSENESLDLDIQYFQY